MKTKAVKQSKQQKLWKFLKETENGRTREREREGRRARAGKQHSMPCRPLFLSLFLPLSLCLTSSSPIVLPGSTRSTCKCGRGMSCHNHDNVQWLLPLQQEQQQQGKNLLCDNKKSNLSKMNDDRQSCLKVVEVEKDMEES